MAQITIRSTRRELLLEALDAALDQEERSDPDAVFNAALDAREATDASKGEIAVAVRDAGFSGVAAKAAAVEALRAWAREE